MPKLKMSDVCDPNWRTAEWAYYRYVPSVGAAAFFCVVFGILSLLHAFQLSKSKTWYLWALCVGGICEFAGYAARLANTLEEPGCWSLGAYIVQNVLILIAPAFMAASIYMILGRIILLTEGECHAIIKRRWLTKLFVTGDVISLMMQASGGGLMANGETMETGESVVIGGLFVQLIIFGLFVVVAVIFHRRMVAAPTNASLQTHVRWRRWLLVLYVTSGLIWVRCLVRAIEYILGNDGVMMTTEAYIYVFDATLMAIAFAWLNWFHPSEIGLLLRGEPPVQNGLQLVMRSNKKSYQQHMGEV